MITKEKIQESFIGGIDCAQVIIEYFSKDLDITTEEARKIGASFGGGMYQGSSCGAYIGALIVLGMKYGHHTLNAPEEKVEFLKKLGKFQLEFQEKYKTNICKEMLKVDITTEEGLNEALQKNLLTEFCPMVVFNTIQMLENIIKEEGI